MLEAPSHLHHWCKHSILILSWRIQGCKGANCIIVTNYVGTIPYRLTAVLNATYRLVLLNIFAVPLRCAFCHPHPHHYLPPAQGTTKAQSLPPWHPHPLTHVVDVDDTTTTTVCSSKAQSLTPPPPDPGIHLHHRRPKGALGTGSQVHGEACESGIWCSARTQQK